LHGRGQTVQHQIRRKKAVQTNFCYAFFHRDCICFLGRASATIEALPFDLKEKLMSPFRDTGSAGARRSFGATLIAIAWSFIGLRRKSDFDQDAAGAMNPVYVIVAGLLGTALFIGVLLLAVRFALA
jgi:hypothetical protein